MISFATRPINGGLVVVPELLLQHCIVIAGPRRHHNSLHVFVDDTALLVELSADIIAAVKYHDEDHSDNRDDATATAANVSKRVYLWTRAREPGGAVVMVLIIIGIALHDNRISKTHQLHPLSCSDAFEDLGAVVQFGDRYTFVRVVHAIDQGVKTLDRIIR